MPSNDAIPRQAHYRMRDLVRESGVRRETIHFYLSEGLLPPPIKTGRNAALYTGEHLDRLRKIRELRDHHFLPLKAIRAILHDEEDEVAAFTLPQQDLLKQVRTGLWGLTDPASERTTPLDLRGGRLTREEIDEMESAGIIDVERRGKQIRVSSDDADIVDAWARMKAEGIDPSKGFRPSDAKLYVRGIERIVRDEVRVFSRKFPADPAQDPAGVVERVLPVIERLLGALHRKMLRRFFESLPEA